MRFRKHWVCLAATLLAVGSPQRAKAWGCEGHRIVAWIALAHLSPQVAQKVESLLRENPIDPALKRFCGPSADPMVDASTWADDIRDARPLTFPYHFIDIPLGARRASFHVRQVCPPESGCLLTALATYTRALKEDHDPARQAEALRFLIHFVGDAHQPLHDSNDGDRGGNCVPITYLAKPPRRHDDKGVFNGGYSPNLHSAWDTLIIRSMLESKSMKVEDLAKDLDSHYTSPAHISAWTKASAEDWVWEGQALAESVAYGALPVKVPAEDVRNMNDCLANNDVSARRLALHEEINGKYEVKAEDAVREQLVKAGVRLAALLNNSLETAELKNKRKMKQAHNDLFRVL